MGLTFALALSTRSAKFIRIFHSDIRDEGEPVTSTIAAMVVALIWRCETNNKINEISTVMLWPYKPTDGLRSKVSFRNSHKQYRHKLITNSVRAHYFVSSIKINVGSSFETIVMRV